MNHYGPISREDYEEPSCVLCMDQNVPKPIPQRRIREKLDEYMSRRDYAGAERHLNYWLAEAQQNGDLRGEFFVRGEMMGHYRKTGNKDQAILNANEGLNLIERLGFENTLSAGTAYVNAATVYDAFGMPDRSPVAHPAHHGRRGLFPVAVHAGGGASSGGHPGPQ